MAGMKQQNAESQLRELNRLFHDRSIAAASFYQQLAACDLDVDRCVLVELVPDGAAIYFGRLISPDGTVLEFDLDLESPDYSEWSNVTDQFTEHVAASAKHKPWLPEVIAHRLHLELCVRHR